MEPKLKIDRLYADFRAAWGRLKPYLQRPLTYDENERRTSIIRDEILPLRDRIIEIESGLS
jgi:hypothetical protein